MRLTFPGRRALAAALLASATLAGGCSVHAEIGKPKSVSRAKLAAAVKQRLEQHAGKKAESVTCAGDLPAEVGAAQRCTLVPGGDAAALGVTVTVASVDGDDVKFDIETDHPPAN